MRRYPPEFRDEAVERGVAIGAAKAARELDVKVGTLRSWMSRAGVMPADDAARERTARATATNVLNLAQRQTQLASDLLDDIAKLRSQLFAPLVVKKPMNVNLGAEMGSRIEVAEVELSRPTPSDQYQLMRSIVIAIDKVQLLSGEATERIESTVVNREQRLAEARKRADLRLVSGE